MYRTHIIKDKLGLKTKLPIALLGYLTTGSQVEGVGSGYPLK